MSAAALGFLMVTTFIVVVMKKWMSAVPALVLIPLIFSVLAGTGPQTGVMMMDGMKDVAPTAMLLIFAVLYFGVMIDAGLFQPLVTVIVQWVGVSPVRATVGHATLATVVGLDGDGTTTTLVTTSSLLPVYRRLNISVLIFAVIGSSSFMMMNLSPWGGPTTRVAAALRVDPLSIFLPLLPVIGCGLVFTFLLAWWFGRREIARGNVLSREAAAQEQIVAPSSAAIAEAFNADPSAARPRLLIFNLILTLALIVLLMIQIAPLPVLFLGGLAIALTVNYPSLAEQRTRVYAHSGNALSVGAMVFAAGAFTGVMSGTGMIEAMAISIVNIMPESLGRYFAVLTALISIPLGVFVSSDALFFGIVPVIAQSAGHYGIPPEAIGRAALLGHPMHALSPIVASIYLKCALLGIELGEMQRFAWRFVLLHCFVLIIAAILFGVIPI